jgi:hypothetical protein
LFFINSNWINFLLHTNSIKYSFTFKIVPFKQLLTVDML